jgi:peroxiredoxin
MLPARSLPPDFSLPTLRGTTASLAEMMRSGPVLLAFFKTTCPTCQYTFPFVERLTAANDLQTLGISQDDRRATAEFCRAFGLSFAMALDDSGDYKVSNAYKITHVPSLFLVEGDSITEAFSGFSRQDLDRIGQRFGVSVFRSGEKTPDFRPG